MVILIGKFDAGIAIGFRLSHTKNRSDRETARAETQTAREIYII